MSSPAFLEAIFRKQATAQPTNNWQDCSTPDYFLFKSASGAVSLRKRSAYPATFAAAFGTRLIFGYGNSAIGQTIAHASLSAIPEELFYHDEFLFVEFDTTVQTARLQRGAFSTLPVFVGYEPGIFALSNKFERTYELLGSSTQVIDHVALAEVLCSLPTYDRTLCQSIRLAYDRMRIEWSGNEYHQERYHHIMPPHARRIKPHATSDIREVRVRLEHALDNAIHRHTGRAPLGCDLSGGMDSALIAGHLQDRGHELRTITLGLPGEMGAAQQQKLRALQQRFGFPNYQQQLDSIHHNPWESLLAAPPRAFYHYQFSAHATARAELLRWLAEQGITSLLTGAGGDELCDNLPDRSLHSTENLITQNKLRNPYWPSWLTSDFRAYFQQTAQAAGTTHRPVSLLSSSVASAMANASHAYFDYNIWPVAPLANPSLYAYCQGLPVRYRHNRVLTRMYLQARNFPPVIYGPTQEHFSNFLLETCVRHLGPPLRHFLDRSVLASYGLIDRQKLWQTFTSLSANMHHPQSADIAFKIVSLLNVEINLQALGLRW